MKKKKHKDFGVADRESSVDILRLYPFIKRAPFPICRAKYLDLSPDAKKKNVNMNFQKLFKE